MSQRSMPGPLARLVGWLPASTLILAVGCTTEQPPTQPAGTEPASGGSEAVSLPIPEKGKKVVGVRAGRAEKPFDPRELLKAKKAQ